MQQVKLLEEELEQEIKRVDQRVQAQVCLRLISSFHRE